MTEYETLSTSCKPNSKRCILMHPEQPFLFNAKKIT